MRASSRSLKARGRLASISFSDWALAGCSDPSLTKETPSMTSTIGNARAARSIAVTSFNFRHVDRSEDAQSEYILWRNLRSPKNEESSLDRAVSGGIALAGFVFAVLAEANATKHVIKTHLRYMLHGLWWLTDTNSFARCVYIGAREDWCRLWNFFLERVLSPSPTARLYVMLIGCVRVWWVSLLLHSPCFVVENAPSTLA